MIETDKRGGGEREREREREIASISEIADLISEEDFCFPRNGRGR